MAGILSRVPGIVSKALSGAGIVTPATISRPGSRVSDGRGGFTAGAPDEFECAAIVTDYTDFQRSLSEGAITIRDRRAIVTAQGLAIAPQNGDTFTQDGQSWKVIQAVRDPAAATFDVQLRPA